MRAACVLVLAMATALAGCSHALTPSDIGTGLTGVMVRGPLQPVCQAGVPCDGPLQASFAVQQDGRLVTTFKSDAGGRFTVSLPPGTYLIVPSQTAAIMSPSTQVRQVVVGPDTTTTVRLEFDTGIR